MPTEFYLDTARLGLMSPTAKIESETYLRMAQRESASASFEKILFEAADNGGTQHGFQTWDGLDNFKCRLRRFAGLSDEANVLIAGRTKTFARIAARLLFGHCETLLVTDLGWPDYIDLLTQQAEQMQRKIVCVELAQAVLRDRATPSQIIDLIADAYHRGGCDGLFLTAISNTGIAIDVPAVINRLEMLFDLPFVAVDGAQHLAHLPAKLAGICDFYFAGTHKWLGSHLPLAVAFYARGRSLNRITATVQRLLKRDEIDDPLLNMINRCQSSNQPFGETVNVASLFAASGALADAANDGEATISNQQENVDTLSEVLGDLGWQPLRPNDRFRSGILLAESNRLRNANPSAVRDQLQQRGIAVTAYEKGLVRLSAPKTPLTRSELAIVREAFQSF